MGIDCNTTYPISATCAPTPTTTVEVPVRRPAGSLPQTGANAFDGLLVGAAVIVAGIAATIAGRRRVHR